MYVVAAECVKTCGYLEESSQDGAEGQPQKSSRRTLIWGTAACSRRQNLLFDFVSATTTAAPHPHQEI